MNAIRQFCNKFDSKYATIHHPWIEIIDGAAKAVAGRAARAHPAATLGFVTGIYARSGITRGVLANEVVLGLTKFEININKARQDVLNPENIDALRFFPGRGNRVWGARLMCSDREWKYINARRLFIYDEHSIEEGTQFAVFEPNGLNLWANIVRTVEDFESTKKSGVCPGSCCKNRRTAEDGRVPGYAC
jgi:phage tail sheath protein FI